MENKRRIPTNNCFSCRWEPVWQKIDYAQGGFCRNPAAGLNAILFCHGETLVRLREKRRLPFDRCEHWTSILAEQGPGAPARSIPQSSAFTMLV